MAILLLTSGEVQCLLIKPVATPSSRVRLSRPVLMLIVLVSVNGKRDGTINLERRNYMLSIALFMSSLSQPDQALVDKLRNLQAQEKIVKAQLKARNVVIKGKKVFILTPVGDK